jgi:glycosyltransferase involved in cell wall biosynthesis
MGHEVLVIASTEVFDAHGHTTYTDANDYTGHEGARVIRLPYCSWLPHPIARRFRSYPGVKNVLFDFAPDVIMFHGASAWELLTVSEYARKHPNVIFNIDSHADAHNSGQNWVSRKILHQHFYGPILRRAMQRSGPLLCISLSVKDFARDVYKISESKLEFFPLGGRILPAETRDAMRNEVRETLGIGDDTIMIVQSGKQDKRKKLSQSLRALAKVDDPNLKLVIAGVLQDDVKQECEALINADPRVTFLGWQSSDELTKLLCAADVYLQPGTQSATMQHSLCCGCAVILDAVASHKPYVDGNGWLINSNESLASVLSKLSTDRIDQKKAASLSFAKRMLDYQEMAKKLLTNGN